MKRTLLSLFLILILLLTGCGGTISHENTQTTVGDDTESFAVGWSRVTITPETDVPLDGVGSGYDRVPNEIQDDLTASLIAISDSQTIVLLCTVDNLFTHETIAADWAAAISQATQIPARNIFFSATHTHSAPDLDAVDSSMQSYLQLVNDRLVEGAREALSDLTPAQVRIGSAETSGLTFVRRYLLSDGTFDSGGGTKGTEVAHEGEADEQLQMIRFVREEKKDVLLVNWQAHPGNGASQNVKSITADYIGVFRRRVEKDGGEILCAFFQGAAGDLDTASRLSGETRALDYRSTGVILANTVLASLSSMTTVPVGTIKVTNGSYIATVDPAKSSEATMQMPLSAFCIGDIAFINCPYEMFCANGLVVKSQSPFAMTFVCTNSGGNYGYIPSEDAFPHGAFEVNQCKFVSGTAETLVNEYLTMLGQMKG